jgi:hypothetical protein
MIAEDSFQLSHGEHQLVYYVSYITPYLDLVKWYREGS